MSQQKDIKQIIKLEYLKCAQDPAHFMSKYCQIQHPQRGRVHFQLYPFQSRVLKIFKDHPYIFNLGHGVLPETDPNMMDFLIKTVKNY